MSLIEKLNARKQQAVVITAQEAEVSPDLVLEGLSSAQFTVRTKDIIEHLLEAISLIPSSESFDKGEVAIFILADNEKGNEFESIIAAGTPVMNAILYFALGANPNFKEMFTISQSKVKVVKDAVMLRSMAFRTLTALIEFYLTRGDYPRPESQAELSKNTRERTLVGVGVTKEGELAASVASFPLTKFPMSAFLQVTPSMLDTITAKRIMLSPAGTKFYRYATLCKMFGKTSRTQTDEVKASLAFRTAVLNIKPDQFVMFHPQHPCSAQRPGKFSRKAIVLLLKGLAESEIVAVLKYIKDKGMLSFMKDTQLYKEEKETVSCPGLHDPELNDGSVTVASLFPTID
jgi:hypothetical protein